MTRKHKPVTDPTVTFWSAARTVTGSMHQLDAAGRTFLLDCGLFQGHREESRRRNQEFPLRPKDIDAVLLSHAHIDHCGNLPNLVRQGFVGPVYCTPATRALAAVMLGDAAKVQEEDAAYLNRKRQKGEPKVEPLYDGRDVYRTLRQLESVPYGTPTVVAKGVEATFVDAGHLLGSAMIGLRLDGPNGERRLTFTGDLGRRGLPILRDPAAVPPADLLISESTYGGHTHEPVEETAERLGQVVKETVDRGGKLLIPAFAVGRTQTVVYFLHQLVKAGRLPDIPIYVDSPLAARATEVFRSHPECFNEETLRLSRADPDLFGERRIRPYGNSQGPVSCRSSITRRKSSSGDGTIGMVPCCRKMTFTRRPVRKARRRPQSRRRRTCATVAICCAAGCRCGKLERSNAVSSMAGAD
jgi:metallo-beta-lactamase family protein